MDPIVIQITDLLRFVFRNPSRALAYMNTYFSTYMDAMQYCEEIENGFLFIFRDFEAFQFRSEPLAPPQLEEPPVEEKDMNFFFRSFFVPKRQFPKKGIDIEVKIIEGDPNNVLPRSIKFVQSVDPEIIIQNQTENAFVFHVPDYKIIQRYTNSLFRRFKEKPMSPD